MEEDSREEVGVFPSLTNEAALLLILHVGWKMGLNEMMNEPYVAKKNIKKRGSTYF